MKLVTKVTSILAALAAVAMLASCGSTSAPAAADTAASNATDALWSWEKIPLSDIGTDDTVIDDRFILDPVRNGIGAEFAAVAGKAKFKTEGLGTAIYMQNKSATNKDNIKEVFQTAFEVVTKDARKVTLTISGNGDATPARVMAVFAPGGDLITYVDQRGQDATEELAFDAPVAGTYTIKASGMRIYAVHVE